MAVNRKKNLKKNGHVPQTLYEAEALVLKIHQIQIEVEKLEAQAKKEIGEYETRIESVKKNLKEGTKSFNEEIQLLAGHVYAFASSHRKELLEEAGKKTVDLSTGDKFRWYLPKSSVSFEDEEEAVRELENKGLAEAVRIVKEVNKEYLLKHPEIVDTLETIALSQEEIFEIILTSIGMALEKGKRKFKRKAV